MNLQIMRGGGIRKTTPFKAPPARNRELLFLILQFFKERNYQESMHLLERASGVFFDLDYFEDSVKKGEWEEVERYLLGFTKPEDSRFSRKIFFEIRKQKYYEALYRHDHAKAVEILNKDLKLFSSENVDIFRDMTMLLTEDLRENKEISFTNVECTRTNLSKEMRRVILSNPLLNDKLQFPILTNSTLMNLISQSLNWRPNPFENPMPSLDLGAVFVDRSSAVTTDLALCCSNKGSSDNLPRNVVVNIDQGSAVKSMDFHPVQQTLLLVGSNIGEITIWEVGGRERLVFQNFKVWNLGACSMNLQASLAIEHAASVNRVIWSPDGALFGVAYSKHIVHVYSYHGGRAFGNQLEIEAHDGYVGDIAFSHPNNRLCIITCGEDKIIKVWDCISGAKQFTFEGHAAPVFSLCPHQQDPQVPSKRVFVGQFLLSTSVDGKIMAWLYDNEGPRVKYDAPGSSCSRMAYSTDGTRLFSCGTNKEGESYIVEWNESEGLVKRKYEGLGKHNVGVIQFDTTRNRFLAAGDEFQIKFWDMETANLFMATGADGGLTATPCIRFNKEGMLLAVSTNENGIKVLANSEGARLLHSIERHAEALKAASTTVTEGQPLIRSVGASSLTNQMSLQVGDRIDTMESSIMQIGHGQNQPHGKSGLVDNSEKSNILKRLEINEPSELRSLQLADGLPPVKVARIAYTNAGIGILALAGNAEHKVWRWSRNDQNPSGKATTSVAPNLCQSCGMLMTNCASQRNAEDAIACFALSKNDSYLASASGGKISLYNVFTFQTLTTFMMPEPTATFIAFYPQDNDLLAIGMDDSSIQIYNVKIDEVIVRLKGHKKRITGLAFSNALHVLVSSGADSQNPVGYKQTRSALTCVHFDEDGICVLAVHETHLAIYKAPSLRSQRQWIPQAASGSILDAVFSCDSLLLYACLEDKCIAVLFSRTFQVMRRINPSAFIPSYASSKAYPLVIAAHPTERNQFAVGLSDGGVYVLEPLESEGKWSVQ